MRRVATAMLLVVPLLAAARGGSSGGAATSTGARTASTATAAPVGIVAVMLGTADARTALDGAARKADGVLAAPH